jgi:phosphatidate cytidylyltransferase
MAKAYSNLLARVLVAVIAIPFILYASEVGGVLFFLFVTAVSILALREFLLMAGKKGVRPQTVAPMIAVICIDLSFFREHLQLFILPHMTQSAAGFELFSTLQLLFIAFSSFVVVVLTVELFRDKGSAMANAGYSFLGVMYIGLCGGTFIGIRELYGTEFPHWLLQRYLGSATGMSDAIIRMLTYQWGGRTIISIFASIWMCDTSAYFGGKAMGKHKLFLRVSPNKTWEGAVWGFLAAIGTMIVARQIFLPYLELHQAIVIGGIIGVFGQVGDLVESLMKRDAGVKDSSGIIPGHGGVFDRFDSLLFVSPIIYLYIGFVVLS